MRVQTIFSKRLVSMLLLAVMLLGMLPTTLMTTAFAAEETFYTEYSTSNWVTSYTSTELGKCSIRTIPANYNGEPTFAVCYDRGLGLPTGKYTDYTSLGEVEISFAAPFVAYLQQIRASQEGEAAEEWYITVYSCLAQLGAWYEQAKGYRAEDLALDSEAISHLATDFAAVLTAFGTPTTKIEAMYYVEKIVNWWESNTDNWTFRMFQPGNTENQRMLIAVSDSTAEPPVFIQVKKTDTSSNPLSGAVFGVYSDSACTTELATMTTGADGVGTAGPLITSATTLYVKEISAPPGGYTLSTETKSVTVSEANSTAGTAADAGTFLNNITIIEYDDGVVIKVDADSGVPLSGAIFRFVGTDEDGYAQDASFTSNSKGVVDMQWTDPNGERYLPPGDYTVTESQPPSGYEPTDESYELKLEYYFDSELQQYVAEHSGPIVFRNYKQHTIELIKVDGNGRGLSGALFDIYYNGNLLHSGKATNSSGKIILTEVQSGTYTFVETQAPAGYVLPKNNVEILYIDNQTTVTTHTLTMVNYEYPEIVIRKYDDSGYALRGAEFKVEIDGTSIGAFTTNTAGSIILSYADYGKFLSDGNESWTVVVTETKAPVGYELATPNWASIEIKKGQTAGVLTFINNKQPDLIVSKQDGNSKAYLAGATFQVTRDTEDLGTFETGADGKFNVSPAIPGTYYVTEVSPPTGYTSAENPTQIIEVKADGTKEYFLHFENYEYPGIRIKKISTETGDPLENAVFKITIDGTTFGSLKTDANGQIFISYDEYKKFLTDGKDSWTIRVEETEAPKGYIMADPNWQENELYKGQELSVFTFNNSEYPSIIIEKKDSVTKELLPNTQFQVWIDAASLGTYWTDANGRITIDYADYKAFLGETDDITWTITVRELSAPKGYFAATAATVEQTNKLEKGVATSVFSFENQPLPNVEVTKYDSKTDKLLAGVTYTLTSNSSVETYTAVTNSSGVALFEKVPEGTYTLSETKVPTGYILSAETHTVVVKPGCDQLFQFTYENDQTPALTIIKRDKITNDLLENVKFRVSYRADNNSGTWQALGNFTTNANGEIVFTTKDNLQEGWYQITEVEAPLGYSIDTESKEIHLKGNDEKTVTFFDIPLSALVIYKIDSSTGLPVQGATFTVRYLGGTSGSGGTLIHQGVTSVNGTIVLTNLDAGSYVVEEITAAEGYELSNPSVQTAYLSGKDQDVVQLTFANAKKGEVIIQKLDSATGLPLAGATFKVTDSSGAVIGANNGIFTTDASGIINLTEYLAVGSTIVVTETKAPDGYVLDTNAQTLKIKENTVHMLTFYNSPKSGLQIVKIDSVTKQPIKDAEFTIYKKSGDLLGTYVTDEDGIVIIDNLSPGWIKIVETKAPGGYILDDTPKDVEITNNQFIKVTFENVPQGGLQIIKLDEETRRPIPNVEFAVSKQNGERIGTYRTNSSGIINLPGLASGWYVVSEVKSASGYLLDDKDHSIEVKDGGTAVLTVTNRKASAILIHKIDSVTGKGIYGVSFLISDANNNPLITVTSDQNGYVYVPDLPDGKYHVREIEAAKNYILDTGTKTFYIRYGSTSEIEWKNTPEMGQIQITKKSADDNPINGFPAGALLADAVFEVYDRAGNKVDTIRTDKNGWAATKTLPIGRYTIREVQAPAYYSATAEVINAEIEFSGQIIRIEVLNKSVYTNVSVTKRGYTEVVPGQLIRYDFKNIGNNSTVPLDSFYWRDTLPTDAVRLDKIITGTWSSRLSYKIVYKTNLSGGTQRTLADNLSTDKVYTIDASPAALGLASNEYVTEYMFVFGRVPAGFKQVEAPYIYCKVLAGLPHEYRFTNKTDVGGLWGNQWIMANDRWVTIVYGKSNPPTLPRTGY